MNIMLVIVVVGLAVLYCVALRDRIHAQTDCDIAVRRWIESLRRERDMYEKVSDAVELDSESHRKMVDRLLAIDVEISRAERIHYRVEKVQ